TPDPGPDNGTTDCNTASAFFASPTGSRSSCVSTRGAFDMVGKLWEWVADWVPRSTTCGTWSGSVSPTGDTQCQAGAAETGDPEPCCAATTSESSTSARTPVRWTTTGKGPPSVQTRGGLVYAAAMEDILQVCAGSTERTIPAGATILADGERAGVLYVLIEGEIEVLKGDYRLHAISKPGAVFGEISVLLDAPHTATARTTLPSRFYVIENPREFLVSRPSAALGIASLLAERLNLMTTYLVDLKRQYEGSEEHFGMIDEVLGTLSHAQREEHEPGSERDPDPTVA
ncbi:MAG: cyclic nucleotide-binding domain-containing protein, partial [Candidatus Rokuibacteriota bacterium]